MRDFLSCVMFQIENNDSVGARMQDDGILFGEHARTLDCLIKGMFIEDFTISVDM